MGTGAGLTGDTAGLRHVLDSALTTRSYEKLRQGAAKLAGRGR